MCEEIERVFNATGAFDRTGIDSESEVLGQLLPIENPSLLRQFYRAFKQTTIQVVCDEPLAERLQRALRERRLVEPRNIEDHLPARIDNAQFYGFGVRRLRICLQ